MTCTGFIVETSNTSTTKETLQQRKGGGVIFSVLDLWLIPFNFSSVLDRSSTAIYIYIYIYINTRVIAVHELR